MKTILSIGLFFLGITLIAREYHVSIQGSDVNDGSVSKPFRTINRAAQKALPGDTITVYEGVYRERVDPKYGGTSDINRIVYRSAAGQKVEIKGSEVIKNWQKVTKGVWKVTLNNSFFGTYNPYRDIIKADWFKEMGRTHHTGEVYLNGTSFFEIDKLENLLDPKPLDRAQDQGASLYQWYCESDAQTTTIYANFHAFDPNKELVEINVRPTVFFPSRTGINYITVSGFKMSQAATTWAPPTAEQIGLIGPHWSKGWIIENNEICHSKCSGISLGKERSTGQNYAKKYSRKSGHINQVDVVFKAIKNGWSKENVGSHIIRNNSIHHCEQTGICGNLGGVFSKILNNHIYDIFIKRQWDGAEIAGIKLHAPIDVVLESNLIHNAHKGMWMDWQSQGTQITGNILYDNTWVDIHNEVNHGPMIVANNLFMSPLNIWNMSAGTAYIHNLFYGKICSDVSSGYRRFTPYHYPHSTAVAGLMTAQDGDDHFKNNIFYRGPEVPFDIFEKAKSKKRPEGTVGFGLISYDAYPVSLPEKGSVIGAFTEKDMPIYANNNLHIATKPCKSETGVKKLGINDCSIVFSKKADGAMISIELKDDFDTGLSKILNSKAFGEARISEAAFDDENGTYIYFDTAIFGERRKQGAVIPGPFVSLKKGTNVFSVMDVLIPQ